MTRRTANCLRCGALRWADLACRRCGASADWQPSTTAGSSLSLATTYSPPAPSVQICACGTRAVPGWNVCSECAGDEAEGT